MTKNGTANIREVYDIATRLEEKIDKIEARVSSIEGKTSILAIVWSSIIAIVGISIGIFIKK